MKTFYSNKKMSLCFLLLISWNAFAMEEGEKENDKQLLGCSLAKAVPLEIFEQIIVTLIDQSKDIDEAAVSLRGFQYSDKETNQVVDACLQNKTFSEVIQRKLVQKCEKDLPCIVVSWVQKLVKKFLCSATDTTLYWPHCLEEYLKFPIMARFIYTYFVREDYRCAFLQEALLISDIKTVKYCLNHEGDVNAVYVNAEYYREGDEWTALSLGIERENIDLVRTTLSHRANPDQLLKYSETDRGANWYEFHTTPRGLARKKGNSEILKLLENHQAAEAK